MEDSACRVGDQLSYKRICWCPKYILSLESLGISNTPFVDLDTCMLALCRLAANFCSAYRIPTPGVGVQGGAEREGAMIRWLSLTMI